MLISSVQSKAKFCIYHMEHNEQPQLIHSIFIVNFHLLSIILFSSFHPKPFSYYKNILSFMKKIFYPLSKNILFNLFFRFSVSKFPLYLVQDDVMSVHVEAV